MSSLSLALPTDLTNAIPATLLSPVVLRADERQHRTIFSMISPLTNAPAHADRDIDAMYMDGRDAPSVPAAVNGYDSPAPTGMWHGISRFEHCLRHTQSLPPLVGEYGTIRASLFISREKL